MPSVAQEYGLDPHEFEGRGLDAHSYVGDKGGGLWGGLCKAKGNGIKNKTVSDFFHLKQDINRHKVYFTADRGKTQFEKLMLDAYDAVTAVQAEDAEKSLEKLINKLISRTGGGGGEPIGKNGAETTLRAQHLLLRYLMQNPSVPWVTGNGC